MKIMEKSLNILDDSIFNHPECPAWAKYAAVDSTGDAYWFGMKPVIYVAVWVCDETAGCDPNIFVKHIPGKWDAEKWEDSLTLRDTAGMPEELPEWVKDGAYGYDLNQKKYFRVLKVRDKFIADIEMIDSGEKKSGGKIFQYCIDAAPHIAILLKTAGHMANMQDGNVPKIKYGDWKA